MAVSALALLLTLSAAAEASAPRQALSSAIAACERWLGDPAAGPASAFPQSSGMDRMGLVRAERLPVGTDPPDWIGTGSELQYFRMPIRGGDLYLVVSGRRRGCHGAATGARTLREPLERIFAEPSFASRWTRTGGFDIPAASQRVFERTGNAPMRLHFTYRTSPPPRGSIVQILFTLVQRPPRDTI